MRSLLIAGSLFALSAPAYADANKDLAALVDDVWATALKESPVYASTLGVNDYANELGDYTLAAQDRRAADAGHTGAMNNLGSSLSNSSDTAVCREGVALLERAALAGDSSAMFNLSSMYGTGSALPLDRGEQQRWLLKSGEAGHPSAMLYLGLAFETGRDGVVKDRDKAIYWYRKAAEHNDDWRRQAALDALRDLGQ